MKITQLDYDKIESMEFFLCIKDWSDSRESWFHRLVRSQVLKHLTRLEQEYFKQRLIEACREQGMLPLVDETEKFPHFLMFRSVISNRSAQ